MSNVLVAGGAGFVGSHLVDRLLDEGCCVDVVDDMSTGHTSNLRERGLQGRDLRIFLSDVSEGVGAMRSDGRRYDVVFNMTGPSSLIPCAELGVKSIVTNVLGTRNLLALAREHGSVFVQASSDLMGPHAESERCAEALCREYARLGVDVRVARLFDVYGERTRSGSGNIVNEIVRLALSGSPATIVGDDRQKRSLCYVSDAVDALVKLANIDVWEHGPMDVGNDLAEASTLDVVDLLREAFPGLIVESSPSSSTDNTTRRVPDLALARNVLGYEPRVFLFEGLERTIGWTKAIQNDT